MYGTRKKRTTVIREAAEWRLLIQAASLDEAQRRRFQAWLRVPSNLAEMGRIALVDVLLQRVLGDVCRRRLRPTGMRSKSRWGVPRPRFGARFRLH